MKENIFPARIYAIAFVVLTLTACQKDRSDISDSGMEDFPSSSFKSETRNPSDIIFYALSGTTLDKLSTSNPETVLSSVTITGLQSGERILAIDFRPATGQLYGIGSTSRLYVINPQTGAARMIGSGPLSTTVNGSIVGFDFNPTVDRIRLVTSAGQNLRINPETAAVIVDGMINGAAGAMIAAVAYTNNIAGAGTTTLYDIDVASQKLYKQMPPNDGTLVEVGALKLKVEGEGGFDISSTGVALALFEVNNKATLFRIDLGTGETKIMAKYEKTEMYTGIAIPTAPVAYAVSSTNAFLIFNPFSTTAPVSKSFAGLPSGVNILGIDFRPANGQIYALGSNSQLYTVNASSGAVAAVGSVFSISLSGTAFGFDFNPVVDRIRIVSNTGQNLRVNPNDGIVVRTNGQVDGTLNIGNPPMTVNGVSAAAYSNNFAGTTTTTLFDINTDNDKLYRQDPPNAGTLVEVGSLGINAEAMNGFDIGSTSGIAYALLTSGGSTKLYTINLTNGASAPLNTFGLVANGFTIGLGF